MWRKTAHCYSFIEIRYPSFPPKIDKIAILAQAEVKREHKRIRGTERI